MSGAPTREDEWGSATLYGADQPVEPRTFTEADPMAAGLPVDSALGSALADEPAWGTTTYVERPGRSRRRPGASGRRVARRAVTDTDEPAADPVAGQPGDGDPPGDIIAEADRRLIANSRSMAVGSFASRVTGFVRSVMLVAALGATGAVADAYNSGNNLPNMIYELLLGGVLSSVLIPLLVKAEAEDEDRGLAYTQRLLSIATAALGVMTVLVVAAAPWIAAAFVRAGPQRELTSIFATLLLPEIFFYGLGAMFMAILNIKHVYAPGAWAPLVNNVIMILTIVVFWLLPGPTTLDPGTMTTTQILVLGLGTTLGIAAQALVLIPFLRRTGFRWKWRFRATPGDAGRLKEVATLGSWVLAYVVISQIGVSVIQKVGIGNGGFTVFTNADLLFQMPYGILVVSVLTAIMPRMSRAAVRNDHDEVVADLSLAARLSAVALVPITALLIVLGPTLGLALLSFRQASAEGGLLIGSALAWSAFGLFPFALVMLQLRVFYAMRDGRTPTLINALMVSTKVVLVLVSNELFRAPPGTDVNTDPSVHAVQWLNISTSLSYVVGAIAGHLLLTRRLGPLHFAPVVRTVAQVLIAAAIGAAVAWGVVEVTRHALGVGRLSAAIGLVGGGALGLAVFGVVAWRMRIPDVRRILATARR